MPVNILWLILICYGLNGPGIESRWGWDFPHPSRTALGPTQPPIQWVPDRSRGYQAAGSWCWPHIPSSAEVKERVELYLYSSSGPSWTVLGWPLPLPYLIFKMCTYVFSGSITDGLIGSFHWHNPSGRTMALESTQPLTKMSTRTISWGQRRPVRRADNLATFMCRLS
jgi:hypothetical protein